MLYNHIVTSNLRDDAKYVVKGINASFNKHKSSYNFIRYNPNYLIAA